MLSVEICDVTMRSGSMEFPKALASGLYTLSTQPHARMVGSQHMLVLWSHFVQARGVKTPGTDHVVYSVQLPYPVRLSEEEIRLRRLNSEEASKDWALYNGTMTLTFFNEGWRPTICEHDGVRPSLHYPKEKDRTCRLCFTLDALVPLPKSLWPSTSHEKTWMGRMVAEFREVFLNQPIQ